jgi:signal transduction histidine kinase
MNKINDVQTLHQELRRLAAEDPLRARDQFLQLLESGSTLLDPLLEVLSSPGEGRLRQLIANALRTLPAKQRLIPYLFRWRENETDEFAFRSLEAALADVDPAVTVQSSTASDSNRTPLIDPVIVQAYRYASDRLIHKVRNCLLRPGAKIIRLRSAINGLPDDMVRTQLLVHLGELIDDLNSVGKIVESFEADPDYFAVRPVSITDWLPKMNREYSRQFSAVRLAIRSLDNSTQGSIEIRASDYLLETIFWNLWNNAQEATGNGCMIDVYLSRSRGMVELVFVDNGEGFSAAHQNLAFQESYSTKSEQRGRGLLEIQDAVRRLHGSVELSEYTPGEYRIKIAFPII